MRKLIGLILIYIGSYILFGFYQALLNTLVVIHVYVNLKNGKTFYDIIYYEEIIKLRTTTESYVI